MNYGLALLLLITIIIIYGPMFNDFFFQCKEGVGVDGDYHKNRNKYRHIF